ncbi:MAG: hypothetical protein IKI99_00640, partial [Firmicutes bacterium]|nr:hypothetical protein [Bacillota bacterium]
MTIILSVVACMLMLLFPEITVAASKAAIRIWMNAVVPSLLPFMMIANYLKSTGIRKMAAGNVFTVLMTFFSGYPMGAKLAGDRYRDGEINAKELHRLLCYTMITGPAFMVGGVGAAFYQSKMAGYVLTISHYAAAASCGLLTGRGAVIEKKEKNRKSSSAIQDSDTPFTDCILESFRTLGIVLAYIVLFMIATDFLDVTGLLQSFPDWVSAFCKGLLEMTVGCSEIAKCGCGLKLKLILSSFIISFGGLSVMGQ